MVIMKKLKTIFFECFEIYKKISFGFFYIPIKYNEFLVKRKIAKTPENLEVYKQFAEDAFRKKRLFLGATWHVNIYKKFDEKPFKAFKKLFHSPLKKYFFASFISYIFRKTCLEEDFFAEKCYKTLLKGKKKEASRLFSLLVQRLFDDEKTCSLWVDSFECIADIYTNKKLVPSKDNEKKIVDSVENYKPFKKIITSGMGWSGSGAVFDFFKEFEKVYPLKGEACHIETKMGLYNLYSTMGNTTIFCKNLLRFFGLTLFGFGIYEDYNSYIASKHAKSLTKSDRKKIYAKDINFFCHLLRYYYFKKELDKEKFSVFADILLDTIAKTKGAGKDSIVVFDNIIHTYNIDTVEILDNTVFFCTFRDPRSNYVSRLYEDTKFSKDVSQFISNYRSTREKSYGKYQRLGDKKSKVFIVSFEEFVLSESHRNKLADLMDLDLSTQEKYKYFKPWESEKNVFIHESYENSDEIETIKNAIPKYCLDLHKIKKDLK